jgi:uncharacterized GH25 family protein
MMKKAIVSMMLLLSAVVANAHAVWIETSLIGTKNKSQEVRVYLGEYAEGVRDSVSKWFSNMKDVELFVTAPDGKREQITLKANGNHLVGNFTPSQDGSYALSITHTVAEIYGEVKIIYYASATVNTGKASASQLPAATALAVVPASETPKKLQQTSVKVLNAQQPLAEAKVEVCSPAGWIKTQHSDAKGEVSFAPLEAGQYMFEAVRTEKTPGTHTNGKTYKSITHLVTHCVAVK